MSIQEHLNKIRNAVYGHEVRESIAKGIETAYDDASENGNANMEVKVARGTHPNLRSRLEEVDNKQQQNTAQLQQTEQELNAQLAQTGDRITETETELNARVSETIANAGDGTLPTEVVDMRTVGGKTYTVAGDALRAVSEGEALKKNAITADKISDSNQSVNILDKSKLMVGSYYGGQRTGFGTPIKLITSENWYGAPTKIPVKTGDVVRFNKAYQTGFFAGVDDNDILKFLPEHTVNPPGYAEVVVPEGVTAFYTAVFKEVVDEPMITINNPMPTEYIPSHFKKSLDWLEHKPKSITMSSLADDVVEHFPNSEWIGKTFISNGTSISWQDGKVYRNTTNTARGYQTIIKEKLGFSSYTNVGVSGKAMADGTSNGEGIVTTGLGQNYENHALATIEAGTNDFKLNVQMGDIGSIGDTDFDRTTFYGAYRTLIEFILTENPSIRLVLLTPLHRDNGGYNSWDFANTAGHTLNDYREAIFSLGKMYGLPVCDLYANSGFNKFTLSHFTMDGLHPNDLGYERMGGYVSHFIKNVAL